MYNMKRETGFYRVKYDSTWIISYYHSESEVWLCHGSETTYSDSSFSEINETKIIFDVKEASNEEILNLYSCLIRYGYQEAIDEIINYIFDKNLYTETELQNKFMSMTSTKKEINFEKLQKEINTTQ